MQHNAAFDARETGRLFDFILSHSVMSHAPRWQLELFLANCAAVLKKGGKAVFSLRLTRPNPLDHSGIKTESTTDQWQYPGNTFFDYETVARLAGRFFLSVSTSCLILKLL
jgi:2-polyprenyl-3-methyl-5-hydroxy-6-metoxy-1,4-benzoquinol methylase